jgi:hypothetical protein
MEETFSIRLGPRIAALEAQAKRFNELKKMEFQTPAFKGGMDLVGKIIEGWENLYSNIKNFRELNLRAPEGEENDEEAKMVEVMIDMLEEMARL